MSVCLLYEQCIHSLLMNSKQAQKIGHKNCNNKKTILNNISTEVFGHTLLSTLNVQ